MSFGRSPFDPLTNPEQALELAKAVRLNEKSSEQEALDREGVGELKANRGKASQGSRTRTAAVVVIILVVLVLSLAFFMGLL
jgi:hypothetical protein